MRDMERVWGSLLSLCLLVAAVELKWVERRDKIVDLIPVPLSVPPSQYFEGSEGSWSSFQMRVGAGPQAQQIRVMPSTAWTTLMTIHPQGCNAVWTPGFADCEKKRGGLYNSETSSSTYQPQGIYSLDDVQVIQLYGIVNISTTIGLDTVTFGWPGSPGPSLLNSVVSQMAVWSWTLTGLLGLDPRPVNLTDYGGMNFRQKSLMQGLKEQKSIPSLSYGYTAGVKNPDSGGVGVFGSLTLGGYDSSRLNSSISATYAFYDDVEIPLMINIESLEYNYAKNEDVSGNAVISQNIPAHIDSSQPFIYLPKQDCTNLAKQWGLRWDNQSQYYLISENQHRTLSTMEPFLKFNLGPRIPGQVFYADTKKTKPLPDRISITILYASLEHYVDFPYVSNKTRFIPIRPATNPNAYMLGLTFLQAAYITVDHEQRNFTISRAVAGGGNKKQPLVPIRSFYDKSPEPTKQSIAGLSTAAIAGIAVGIAVLLGLLTLSLFLIHRKKQQGKRAARAAVLSAKEASIHSPGSPTKSSETTIDIKELDSATVYESGGHPTYPMQEIGESSRPAVGEMADESTLNSSFGGFYKEMDTGDGRPIIKVFYEMDASPPSSAQPTPVGTLDSTTVNSNSTTLIGTPFANGSPLAADYSPPNTELLPTLGQNLGDSSPIPQTPLEFYGRAAVAESSGQRGWIGRAPGMPKVVLTPATPGSPTPEEMQRTRWLRGSSGRNRRRRED